MSMPSASTLAARSRSKSPVLATAKLATWSTSVGTALKSPATRSAVMQVTPASSSRVRAPASPNRATARTSLAGARARATGRPTCPVAPVMTMRLPSMRLCLVRGELGLDPAVDLPARVDGDVGLRVPPAGHAELGTAPLGVEAPEVRRADDLG